MIKVNLLKSLGATVAASPSGEGGFQTVATPNAQKKGVIRLLVVFLFPLALYLYDTVMNSTVENELAEVRQKLEKARADRAKFGDTGVRLEALTKDKKLMDEKIEAIREVARGRLRDVKSLDALQNLIPGRTWLSHVQIQNNFVKLEGYTNAEDGIAELIRGLEASPYFSRVEPKSTSAEKIGNLQVKKFVMEFRVGKVQE